MGVLFDKVDTIANDVEALKLKRSLPKYGTDESLKRLQATIDKNNETLCMLQA